MGSGHQTQIVRHYYKCFYPRIISLAQKYLFYLFEAKSRSSWFFLNPPFSWVECSNVQFGGCLFITMLLEAYTLSRFVCLGFHIYVFSLSSSLASGSYIKLPPEYRYMECRMSILNLTVQT